MKRCVQILFSLTLVVLGLHPAGFAATAKIVNIFEMVGAADRIFRGRCTSVEPRGFVAGLPVLEYTFEVIEGLKGATGGRQLVFRQVQAAGKRSSKGIAGLPGYRKGDEVVLFLYPDSRLGLTSPVGLAQGVFQVVRDDLGEVQVMNILLNRNLSDGLSDEQARPAGFSGEEIELLREGAPFPLERLRLVVEQIDSHLAGKVKSFR